MRYYGRSKWNESCLTLEVVYVVSIGGRVDMEREKVVSIMVTLSQLDAFVLMHTYIPFWVTKVQHLEFKGCEGNILSSKVALEEAFYPASAARTETTSARSFL
jgi:hypothetical protein